MSQQQFTNEEYLAWAKSKPQDETFDGINNYVCAVAQFLLATGRAQVPYVLSEEWYDEALPVKRGKKPVMHRFVSPHPFRASANLHPNNTFRHVVVRLELLMAKRDVNDYYFEMRGDG